MTSGRFCDEIPVAFLGNEFQGEGTPIVLRIGRTQVGQGRI